MEGFMAVILDDKLLNNVLNNNPSFNERDKEIINNQKQALESILGYLYTANGGDLKRARPAQQAYYLKRAISELRKHQTFTVNHGGENLPYSEWLETLSDAKKQEAIKQIGDPHNYTSSFNKKKSALDKFIRGKDGLNNQYKNVKQGHNPLLNLWDRVAGRPLSSVNRVLLRPIYSLGARGLSTVKEKAALGGWGGLTTGLIALSAVCFLTATAVGALAWIPAVVGAAVLGGSIYTAVKTKNAWDVYQTAKVEARDRQVDDDGQFATRQQEYMNGRSATIESAEASCVAIKLSGVTADSFIGTGARLNIRDNSVTLSRQVWQKYGDDLTLAFDPAGSLVLGIKNSELLETSKIQGILDAVKKDCGLEQSKISSITILGERLDNTSLSNVESEYTKIFQRQTDEKDAAKAAAEAAAQQAQIQTWNQAAQHTIQERVTDEFLDQVIVRGLKTNDTSVNYEGIALEALKSRGVNVPDGPAEQIYKSQLAEKLKARLETYGIKDGVGSSPAYLAAKVITDNTLNILEGQEATKLEQIATAVKLAANSKDLSSDVPAIAALRVSGLNAQNTAAMIKAIREKTGDSVTLDGNVTNAVMALANDNQLTEEAFKSALGAIDLAPAAQAVNETPLEQSWSLDIGALEEAIANQRA
jgi:hypothetical protein